MIARIAVIAALLAVAAAATYDKCTPAGARCAGEKGYPAVPWLGCCAKTDSCLPDESRGYGRFCLKKPSDYGKGKCYASGARCMGAVGKPYVPFHKCCDKGETCQQDKKRGWGGYCVGAGKGYEAAKKKEAVEKKSPTYKAKCYKHSMKCMGAKGYPHYPWFHCCDAKYKCVVDPKMGWGGYCKKVDDKYVEKYGEVSKGYEYNPKFTPKKDDYYVPKVKPMSKADEYYPEKKSSSYSTDYGYDYGYGYGKKDVKDKPKGPKAPTDKTVKPTVTTVNRGVPTARTVPATVATATVPPNDPAVTQLNLSPSFGCGLEGGEQPISADREPAIAGLDTTSSLDVQVDIPACGTTGSYSEADKAVILDRVCGPLLARNVDAICILERIPTSTTTGRMLADDDLTAVDRQVIVIVRWRIRIYFSRRFGALVLEIIRTITVFIFGPIIDPSPDS